MVSRFITFYRPVCVTSVTRSVDGYAYPIYSAGNLRAKVFGIRVPILWALNQVSLW